MNLVRTLVLADLRRSWRQLLAVALVVAVGGGAIMLALAGARRGDTSFERFRTSVVDGHVFVGVEEAPERLAELDELPTLEVLAPFGYVPIVPRGASKEARLEGGGFASIGGSWLYDVQRPRVLDGRMPDPDAADQMVVNEEFARQFDARPGDQLSMEASTAGAMTGTADRDEVVSVDLEVTAVVRTPLDIGVNTGGPVAYLPPGFLRAHTEVGVARGFGLVRLVGGDASFPAFQRQAEAALDGEPSLNMGLITLEGRSIQRALDVQTTALAMAALVAAMSAIALLVQVASRSVDRAGTATPMLRSIGATRRQRIAALITPSIVAVTLGVVAAGAASALLSPVLPRGLARVAEPDPGPYVDGGVTAAVGLASMVLAAAILLVAATRVTRVSGHQAQDAARSSVPWRGCDARARASPSSPDSDWPSRDAEAVSDSSAWRRSRA